jgi:ADP-L-glycero-D-manno-heptose 6-epimerase
LAAGKNPRVFKWGEQYRDFIYVKDVVAANLKAMAYKGSGVFNVGTGTPATFNEVIGALNKVLKKDLTPEYFDNPYGFYQDRTHADMALSSTMLKFKAKYDIGKGIKDYVSILKKQKRR